MYGGNYYGGSPYGGGGGSTVRAYVRKIINKAVLLTKNVTSVLITKNIMGVFRSKNNDRGVL